MNIPTKKCLAYIFPAIAAEWHLEKNGHMTPLDVPSTTKRKMYWTCEKGKVCIHDWRARIGNRTKLKRSCPYCSNQQVCIENSLAFINPGVAAEWHPTKNGAITPVQVTSKNNQKAWWYKTDCQHQWDSAIYNRVKIKTDCPICKNKWIISENCLAFTHPELALDWDLTKNTQTPLDIGVGSGKKAYWRCEKNHSWDAVLQSRKISGCPKCNRNSTSFPEQAVFFYIKMIFPDAINSYTFRFKDGKIVVDIFIPSLNYSIEYDGYYFHYKKYDVARDEKKNKALIRNNIQLIRIREKQKELRLPLINMEGFPFCEAEHEDDDSLRLSILFVLKELQEYIVKTQGQHKEIQIDIDIERDRAKIMESYQTLKKEKSLEKLAPAIARQFHPTKNGNLTPAHFSAYSSEVVWWLGDCGKNCVHEWKAAIDTRVLQNTQCPFCLNQKVCMDNSLAANNPALAGTWHLTENGKLTPLDVPFGSHRKVSWNCHEGHKWEALIFARNNGADCYTCFKNIKKSKVKKVISMIINKEDTSTEAIMSLFNVSYSTAKNYLKAAWNEIEENQ